MHPESLKVTFEIEAKSLKEAIATLSKRFLRATLMGCEVVREPTDFCLAHLCQRLIDQWQGGKIPYKDGTIMLTFRSGLLETQPDILIYEPEAGDRRVFSKRQPPALAPASQPRVNLASWEKLSSSSTSESVVDQLMQTLTTTTKAIAQLTSTQQKLEQQIQSLVTENADLKRQLHRQTQEIQSVVHQAFIEQTKTVSDQLQEALFNHRDAVSNMLSQHVGSTSRSLSQQIDKLHAQIEHLAIQLEELDPLSEFDGVSIPQTQDEWRDRIKEAWGTVGDYEKYSLSHREDNAETPLCFTPDWIVLCEMPWVRQLSPVLAELHTLLHRQGGIDYVGADILQQFGQHIDKTGDPYYIYDINGFTAYEALWQIAYDPQHSWLPELQQLWAALEDHNSKIFQLFGWEDAAIRALESIVHPTQRDRHQSAHQSQRYSPNQTDTANSLRDYLTMLKMGPFMPITIDSIKKAYKQAMKAAHPDSGGSTEEAQQVNEAYKAVLRHYFPEAT
ncbi:MAG TPA: hypothetical protein ACFE0H_16430 [Elainellaceae cyanobacterium]